MMYGSGNNLGGYDPSTGQTYIYKRGSDGIYLHETVHRFQHLTFGFGEHVDQAAIAVFVETYNSLDRYELIGFPEWQAVFVTSLYAAKYGYTTNRDRDPWAWFNRR